MFPGKKNRPFKGHICFGKFSNFFSTKSTIFQKLNIAKRFQNIFIGFRTLHIILEQKPNLATFEGNGGLRGGVNGGLCVVNWSRVYIYIII